MKYIRNIKLVLGSPCFQHYVSTVQVQSHERTSCMVCLNARSCSPVWYSIDDSHLQVCTLSRDSQMSQSTLQHHLNLQLHLFTLRFICMLYPCPQQSNLQLSILLDVTLHTRPLVPSTPFDLSGKQKFGDFSMNRSCLSLIAFLASLICFLPRFDTVILTAFLYKVFKFSPTLLNGDMIFLHTRVAQDPLTPVHPQTLIIESNNACKMRMQIIIGLWREWTSIIDESVLVVQLQNRFKCSLFMTNTRQKSREESLGLYDLGVTRRFHWAL